MNKTKVKNKKVGIKTVLPFVVLIGLILSSNSSYAFYYIEGSMFEEIIYTEFELILDERDYYLVIDNTGYISRNYIRNESFVCGVIVFRAKYSTYLEFNFILNSSLAESQYRSISLLINEPGNMSFKIIATEEVTVFVTTLQGLEQFESEISEFLDEGGKYRTTYILIGIIGSLLIMSVATVIYARKRIRKDVKKNE